MKKIMVSLILVISVRFVFGGPPVALEELSRPAILIVKYDKVYILEKTTIYIYSLDDFKLIKKFGRAGEGPREFKTNVMGAPMTMSFYDDKLVVNSLNKISFITVEGEFIKEIKNPLDVLLLQIKDGYVGTGPVPDESNQYFIGFRLFGRDFKERNVLYRSDFSVNNPEKILLPLTTFTYNPVYRDKIYIVSSSTDFIIDVFRAGGTKEYSIKKDSQKIPVPEGYKKGAHEWFQNDARFKPMYESMIKKIIKFRDYFPPIRDIQVVDDTIHVITYKRKNQLWECILLDLKGNEKSRVFIPLDHYIPFTYYPILYSVYKKNIYTMIEDVEEETWKIHTTEIKQ
ncbi:MAG: hypothetical protein KAT17_01110 [Candidatus Aminicenantes bacterium]|nr:hypothetical protein [Candidatus Aminicenantes bacterium]